MRAEQGEQAGLRDRAVRVAMADAGGVVEHQRPGRHAHVSEDLQQPVAHALRGLPGQRGHVPHIRVRERDRQIMHSPFHARDHGLCQTVIHLRRAGGPLQLRVPVGIPAMRLPPAFDPSLHRGVLAGKPELGHQPLVHSARGMPLLARHTQIRGQPLVRSTRVLTRHQGTAPDRPLPRRGRIIPRHVLDYRRTRNTKLPGYPRVIRSLSFQLPDTLLDTHRCRHSFPPEKPNEWLISTRESIRKPTAPALSCHTGAYRRHCPK